MDSSTTTNGKVTKVGPNGEKSSLPPVLDVLHATWVETVAEVDGEGRPTRYTVRIPAWSRRRDNQRDQSLVGAVLTVSGSGAARQWAYAQKPNEPSDEGRNWLDEHFGARGTSDADWLRIILPDENVKVGERWTPSPERLATAMTAAGMTVDRSRLSTTATFEGIEEGLGRISFGGDFALLRVPNTDVEWTSGGTLAFEGEMRTTLEPAPLALRALHRKGTLAGEATVDGASMSYDFVIDEKRTSTPGEAAAPSRK
jgi:hypothetical protein